MRNPVSFADIPEEMDIGWINSESPWLTVISFHRAWRSHIVEIHAYLHRAAVSEIDIVCDPHFPNLEAIITEDLPETPHGPRHSVRFVFEQGAMAFLYMDVAFQATTRPTLWETAP
jgi:hypothetical protein